MYISSISYFSIIFKKLFIVHIYWRNHLLVRILLPRPYKRSAFSWLTRRVFRMNLIWRSHLQIRSEICSLSTYLFITPGRKVQFLFHCGGPRKSNFREKFKGFVYFILRQNNTSTVCHYSDVLFIFYFKIDSRRKNFFKMFSLRLG